MHSKTLYMIGNAHLDPVWLWQWQEGFQEAKATFRSVLNLMCENDDFLFTSSSAALYEWVEHNDPAMFEEIKQRVAEGRWEIVGGWWIQPDCNIPGGESFVRQGLYGQRYFQEKLGVAATVGYNPDSFGHAASLPQILLKSGLSSYVFMRPHPHEQHLPSRLFWWESNDGSRVLTFRIPYEYCTWGKGLQQHVERCSAELKGPIDELMCFYGVGNHGGGPTRENLESIREMQANPAYPTLVFSTPSRYFQSVERQAADLPVFHDELQPHAVGCYAAHSGVKRWNRQAENLLITAEKFSALAMRVTGRPYPDNYAWAWKDVLFNQFHDILAGTSIEPAYDDARNLYGEAMAIAGRNLNDAIQSLSWRVCIEPEEGMRPIVVFNPHSWPVRTNVELEFSRIREDDVLLDPDGNRVPMQQVRSLATVASGSRTRLSFLADLPPFGYRTYRMVKRPQTEPAPAPSDDAASETAETETEVSPPPDLQSIETDVGAAFMRPPSHDLATDSGIGSESIHSIVAHDHHMENNRFRVEINPDTGCLQSLYDKHEDFEFLRDEAAVSLVLKDTTDTWSHGVTHFDDVAGRFAPTAIRLVEHGSVKAVIRVESAYGRSTLIQDFTMYNGLDQIDVHVTVDWREQFAMLKLRFPVNVFFSTLTYEIPYGTIQRAGSGDEVSGQSWVDLTGVGRNNGSLLGMSILNDGKYSFSATEKEIDLTVLRSPIYAHHDPYVPQSGERYTFIDQGVQRFTYSLLPHAGSWEEADTVKRAAELNARPVGIVESFHPGPLPQEQSFLSIEGETVIVTAMKRAEDNDDLIIRCLETSGAPVEAAIRLPQWNREIEASFKASEIKTFRVPGDESEPVIETNLIEW